MVMRQQTEAAGEDRREALLSAAEHVFLKKGYHAATMDDVARAAAMSKKTVYQLIASKEELFAALLAQQSAPAQGPVAVDDRDPVAVIKDLLSPCAGFLLSPRHMATIRLIMAEYTHSPELGRIFHQRPSAAGKDKIEAYLARLAEEGTIEISTPKEATSMLIGLAIGEFLIGVLLGFREMPSEEEVARRIDLAARVFLKGARPER